MRAAVADAGPLRYLVLIAAIEVLPRLFERVFVPDIVHAELRHAHAPATVRLWAEAVPAWVTIVATPSAPDADLRLLDAGERAAIALATELRPDFSLSMNAPALPPRAPEAWRSRAPSVCWNVPRDVV